MTKKKNTKTYSIDNSVYEMFDKVCKKNNINKSAYIESCIKDYLKENLGYENDYYYLRENKDYIVSITGKDDTYFMLSDGSKVPQILFYQSFKKINDEEENIKNNTEIDKFKNDLKNRIKNNQK